MDSQSSENVIGIPASSVTYETWKLGGAASTCDSSQVQKIRTKESVVHWMNKLSKKADSYARGIKNHVSLGTNLSQTVKGKLSLGARILHAGGIEKVFVHNFYVEEGEKLLNAFQCFLSTTAGPIAGLLFISTRRIAFHSDRSIKLTSTNKETARIPYKVVIPLKRMKRVTPSENEAKPAQKYIQVVTEDGFEFWFMGFVLYERSFRFLQQAIYISP
ncbi:hypothetical protein HPP92_012483 [Vanilla planifolia]|uniref:GRAM domain-containing protein n=1 Tax=Vanilla planifolia TaxID=51239 RepID=A0A835QWZ4_VANPL|nr:hypothetical protein HPP92_012872 [Vanilla planifolia]KAG0477764.1 hypothetical protein HPP92_012483 [Vanilla planifolia]